jgi:murein DD-endopeptidase MepM/ murein hydrolase activator NlpD
LKKSYVVALVAIFASSASGQQRLYTVDIPSQALPGSIIPIDVEGPTDADSIVSIAGSMSGEPLHFRHVAPATWHALGAISVDAKGIVEASITATYASGRTLAIPMTTRIPPAPPSRGKPRALAVSPTFTKPLDSATQARIDRENATAREIGRNSHDTPRMWSAPFIRPRSSVVTSRFGSGRMFNGTLTSRHLGVDFRGATGDPIVAANRGVVALVANFFLAGNVVYIDHGDGVVTAYFHMIRPLVARGDTVARGQIIGLIGSTGRVTGPHLHWSARYGALTVNPLDLVALGKGW